MQLNGENKRKIPKNHKDSTCKESGLVLNDEQPQFGASPNELISCECCGEECLKIKFHTPVKTVKNSGVLVGSL